MRPRRGRESTHRRRVGPAVAEDVRDGAQIKDEFDHFIFDQFCQPVPVPPAIRDGVMFHHMVSSSVLAPNSNATRRASTRARAAWISAVSCGNPRVETVTTACAKM